MHIRRHVALAAATVASVVGTALPSFVAHADVTDLYVNNDKAANCSDSGSGTQAQPFCTVQAAADAAQPGQTVHIARGSYPEQVTVRHSGTQGSPVTFLGDLDWQGWPRASVGSTWGSNSARQPHAFLLSGVHDVTVKGFLVNTAEEGVLVSDSARVVIDKNSFQNAGNQFTNTATPQTGTPAPSIRLTGQTTATTVSRNYIESSGAAGIAVEAGVGGAVITTNWVTDSVAGGIVVTDAPGTIVTSNTASANCGTDLALAGASTGATIENNILAPDDVPGGCPSPAVELSVSPASTSGTKVDYNVVHAGSGGTAYVWGAATYPSPATFTAASGQGTHDLGVDPGMVRDYPPSNPQVIDSADANAPGELDTDVNGQPRIDDPLVPNAGTGVGYYDRGAVEIQDPISLYGYASWDHPQGHPLDVQITPMLSSPWGLKSASVDFGDQTSAPLTTTTAPFAHTYAGPGTYKVTMTATSAAGTTKTWSNTVTVLPVAQIESALIVNEPDPQIASVTVSGSTYSPWPVASYTVDFGDGTPSVVTDGSKPPTNLRHDYSAAGTYTLTYTVVDDHGRTATWTGSPRINPNPSPQPGVRTVEAVEGGELHEVYPDYIGRWADHRVPAVGSPMTGLGFSYSPTGARVVEAIENGTLHEIYSDPSGNWHDNAIPGAGGNITALGFSYSPTGARVVEAIENGTLHEIYSDPSGNWHDNAIPGAGGNATALGFSYSPTGARVVEAIENGTLHEIYSDPSGNWHDNAIPGAGGNATALGFSYSPTGARVVEAIENGTLHEIYSDPSGNWHDNAIPGAGGNATAVSAKVNASGGRVVEAVEGGALHEIYSDPSGNWHDNAIPGAGGNATAVSMTLG